MNGNMAGVKQIILVRHGETLSNRDGHVLGQSDAPLTAKGESTARDLARVMQSYDIRAILCSPLGRATATAKIYANRLGASIQAVEAMAELSAGDLEGRLRKEALGDRPRIRSYWTDTPPGGESYAAGERRVGAFIAELKSRTDLEEILIVGHAAVNMVFLKLWLKLSPKEALKTDFPHDLYYRLDDRGAVSHGRLSDVMKQGLFIP